MDGLELIDVVDAPVRDSSVWQARWLLLLPFGPWFLVSVADLVLR
ncbi:hypothetical protein SAMN05428997_11884 [Bosea sp. CRIB-10]|nr:hypothetical protein [Bosea sp. CRIB-10]SFD12988.1 hypothetical protein SAMN05428997_11884 [Bosea sp. CRIB-10]